MSPYEQLNLELLNFEWIDREVDFLMARNLFVEEHPDGKLSLLSDVRIPGDTDSVTVEFDPAAVRIVQEMQEKYGVGRGLALAMKIFAVIFNIDDSHSKN